MRYLEDFLKPNQEELFSRLCKMYPSAIVREKCYIIVPGDAPVLLVAHLDTVHTNRVRQICKTANNNILMSPQGIGGDDRCGVYALVTIRERSEKKPWLLFTCDEETGCVGARIFSKHYDAGLIPRDLDQMKMLIEIDRKGRNDAVYYACANKEFEEYISSKGFVTQSGSVSDISYIAPTLRVAAVNLSSGYYEAHTRHEYINRKHLQETVQRVLDIISDAASSTFPAYAYVNQSWGSWGWDSWGVEDDWENPDLEDVPEEIRHEFEALLDYYSPDELNSIRAEEGDWAIRALYESEVGGYFADIPTPEEVEAGGPDIQIGLKGELQ